MSMASFRLSVGRWALVLEIDIVGYVVWDGIMCGLAFVLPCGLFTVHCLYNEYSHCAITT